MKALWTLTLLLLLAITTARADLKWQATRIEFHPAIADKEVKGEFLFTNTGTDAVTIDSVDTGCGCTSATLAKSNYQPGEKGSIQAVFHIGERTGFQDKPIRVNIRGAKSPIVLTMATYIPELMKMEPRYVYWRAGEAPQPRLIKLTAKPDAKITAVHVISPNPRFKATVQTIHQGASYLLIVAPVDTSAASSVVLAINTISGPGIPKELRAFANIIPK